jgi:hemoglobin
MRTIMLVVSTLFVLGAASAWADPDQLADAGTMATLAEPTAVTSAPEIAAAPAEEPVEPYEQSPHNAGVTPITDPAVLAAFHGIDGINRIVDRTVDLAIADPQIGPIFAPFDLVRLRRTLKEQVCYTLGGGCVYTGRDMVKVHQDMGVQTRDFNVMVEVLRRAMDEEGVPFRMQNRLLAQFAPMQRDVIQ